MKIKTALSILLLSSLATAATHSVTLTWNASTGAASYNVKRGTSDGGPYTTVGTATNTNFVDSSAAVQQEGSSFFYVVTAVNAGGESGNSNQAGAVIPVTIPPAPTGLTATPK